MHGAHTNKPLTHLGLCCCAVCNFFAFFESHSDEIFHRPPIVVVVVGWIWFRIVEYIYDVELKNGQNRWNKYDRVMCSVFTHSVRCNSNNLNLLKWITYYTHIYGDIVLFFQLLSAGVISYGWLLYIAVFSLFNVWIFKRFDQRSASPLAEHRACVWPDMP